MPSLAEIFNDPNYTGANAATKQAIFDRYSGQDENYTSANDPTKQAIRERFGLVQPSPQGAAPQPVAPVAQPAEEGFFSRLAKEPGYLASAGSTGLNAVKKAVLGEQLAETGNLIELFNEKYTPEQIAASPELQKEKNVVYLHL